MWIPTHLPFTNTLTLLKIYSGITYSKGTKSKSSNKSIIGCGLHPKVTWAVIVKCFFIPILPPSGVSAQQIIPNCVPCNLRWPIIIISPNVLIRRKWDIVPGHERRFIVCISPFLFKIVPILNALLKVSVITLKLNILLKFAWLIIFLYLESWYSFPLKRYSLSIAILISRCNCLKLSRKRLASKNPDKSTRLNSKLSRSVGSRIPNLTSSNLFTT